MGNSVLLEAEGLVNGVRQADYGTALDNHNLIAAFWAIVFGHEVTPQQAALCMVLVKVAREMYVHKRDNLVDMAGYTEVINKIYEQIEELSKEEE